MKGEKLLLLDVEIEFENDAKRDEFSKTEFKTISEGGFLQESSIFFCGHKKFIEPLKENVPKDLCVLFSTDVFERNGEHLKEILPKLSNWGKVGNVPLAMSFISKPFYDSVVEKDNDEVDGRQMGTCEIDPAAIIAQNVFIGAHVKIESNVKILPGTVVSSHCHIGKGSILYPNVTLLPRTSVGKNCRIHSGTVIGSDGFGYNFDKGVHHKLWHFGGVQIGDDVEIGSNVSVDQGTFGPTLIGAGSKIDNLVQVAHNVKLGTGVILCGQAGCAGSSTAGDYSVFGGGSRLGPDATVGRECQVGGMAGVISDVEDKSVVAGFPARPLKEWLKGIAHLRRLALKK